MAIMTRTADLLQQAIEGETAHSRVRDLVATTTALRSVSIGYGPDPDFVRDLGLRLQAEAAALPVRATVPRQQSSPGAHRQRRTPQPLVLLVGRGLPRALAGIAASALALGGVVGAASRSALPGQALYPVKQILDTAAVTLAGSSFDKGSTLLSQAQDHISEASQLSGTSSTSATDVNLALEAAIVDVTQAQEQLRTSFTETGNPQALLAIQDFSTRAIPQVEALRTRLPSGSLPLLATLRSLLGSVSTNAVQQLASCQTCGSAAESARQLQRQSPTADPGALPVLETGAATGTATGGGTAGSPGAGGATAPPAPGGSGVTQPSAPVVAPIVTPPLASVGPGGATVTVPGVPLPGASGSPVVVIPPVTSLPPITVTTPALGLPSGSSPSKTCVIVNICLP